MKADKFFDGVSRKKFDSSKERSEVKNRLRSIPVEVSKYDEEDDDIEMESFQKFARHR